MKPLSAAAEENRRRLLRKRETRPEPIDPRTATIIAAPQQRIIESPAYNSSAPDSASLPGVRTREFAERWRF